MARKLEATIETCDQCPWCRHNAVYDCVQDSGYDCDHPDSDVGRIVDDGDLENNKGPERNKCFSIPEGCPLPKTGK